MSPITELNRPTSSRVADGLEARLVEAMLDCISRWGLAKTTADDIARAAGVSRATLYRAFPGGKDVAFEALLRHEAARFFDLVNAQLHEADTVEELLVVGSLETAAFLYGHEALSYVLRNEPERVLPAFAFQRRGGALVVATGFVASHLARFVPDARKAMDGAEFVVRMLLSYALDPSPTVDLTDPTSVRRFVRAFLLPVLNLPTDTATKER